MKSKSLTFEQVKEEWLIHFSKKAKDDYLTMYVNIPFCAKKCTFCLYYRHKYTCYKQLDKYLDYLEDKSKYFSVTFDNQIFKGLYVGGGTPSLLRTSQIQRLYDILNNYYNLEINDDCFGGFECNPAYLNEKKLDTILSNRLINRVSMGIQSFDKKIIEDNNRPYVSYKQLSRIVSYIRDKHGNQKVNLNVDLMIGIQEEGIGSLLKSFTLLSQLKIQRITVYCNRFGAQKDEEKFKNHCIKIIGELNDYIRENHAEYRSLVGNLNKYSEVFAWALDGYESNLFKYVYNSSPVAFNNTFGLGLYSNSFIITDNLMLQHRPEEAMVLNGTAVKKQFKFAHARRRKGDFGYRFNF